MIDLCFDRLKLSYLMHVLLNKAASCRVDLFGLEFTSLLSFIYQEFRLLRRRVALVFKHEVLYAMACQAKDGSLPLIQLPNEADWVVNRAQFLLHLNSS